MAQNAYWRRHPPIHLLIAAQVGFKPPEEGEPEELTPDDLLQMFPMSG